MKLKEKIEKTVVASIRPYTKDFRVWNKEWAKWGEGDELNITEATDKILKLVKEELLKKIEFLENIPLVENKSEQIETDKIYKLALKEVKEIINSL